MSETQWSYADDPWSTTRCRDEGDCTPHADLYDTPRDAARAWVDAGHAERADGTLARDVLLYRWDDLEQTPSTVMASEVCDVLAIVLDAYLDRAGTP